MKKAAVQDFSNRKLKIVDLPLVQEIREGIVKLKLSNNNLVYVPWADLVLACPQLLVVHLSKNCLPTLTPDIGLFGYLEELRVDHNLLESLPAEVSMLNRLRKLDLSHNKLRSLPTEFSKLTTLESLDISHNSMKYLPLSLCFLKQLKALDFSDNPLFIKPPATKDIPTILEYIQTIYDSVNSDCAMFQVQLGRNRQSEGPHDMWYRDHHVYFILSWSVFQEQGARPYQEDRFAIFPDVAFEDKQLEYVDPFAEVEQEPVPKKKKKRLILQSADTDSNDPSPDSKTAEASQEARDSSPARKSSPSRAKNVPAGPVDSAGAVIPPSLGLSGLPSRLIRSGSEPELSSKIIKKSQQKTSSSNSLNRRKIATSDNNFAYFAVFDGHGGDKASILLKENFHRYLLNQRDEIKEGKWPDALCKAFLQLDKAFLKTCKREGWHDGSTAIVIIIKPPIMYIANVGDSRAVLCRGKKSIGLSSDHKPDREDEQERIESFGGSVVNSESTGWIARVNGHLAISRSVGDIRLKDPPQGVTAEPEICEVELSPDDQFIILASDGLWDVMTNQECVDLVRKCSDKNKAAEALVEKALKLGSGDNVTALIVWFTWNLEHVSTSSAGSGNVAVSIEK